MYDFLIKETPSKVMGLLGTALFSMAFLFAVSLSGAQLSGTLEASLPDPFAPEKVMAVVDSFAAGYSGVVMGFAEPARQAVAEHTEAIAWAIEEASVPLVRVLGLESLVEYNNQPQVAGLSTEANSGFMGYGSLSVDHLYSLLLGE